MKLRFLFLALCLGLAPASAEASLIGDTVDCAITPTPFWVCSPTSATVGAGAEFDLVLIGTMHVFEVDLDASSVSINHLSAGQFSLGATEFLTLSSLFGPAEVITGFTLTTSGVTGLTSSDIGFSAHALSVDLHGSIWAAGATALITLDTNTTSATTSAPEPASLILFGTALLGAGLRRCRQRRV